MRGKALRTIHPGGSTHAGPKLPGSPPKYSDRRSSTGGTAGHDSASPLETPPIERMLRKQKSCRKTCGLLSISSAAVGSRPTCVAYSGVSRSAMSRVCNQPASWPFATVTSNRVIRMFSRRLGWKDELRWYERAALIVWWLGQFLFGACFVFALAALAVGGFDHAGVDAAMILLVTGFAILFGTRVVLELAVRQRRRRHRHRLIVSVRRRVSRPPVFRFESSRRLGFSRQAAPQRRHAFACCFSCPGREFTESCLSRRQLLPGNRCWEAATCSGEHHVQQ